MSKPISQERMEEALQYLVDTDEECAGLRAEVERCEYKAKRTEDTIFLRLTGSVAERQAQAKTATESTLAWGEYFIGLQKFEGMKNKRATQSIVFEAWRSLNSNRRQAQ